MENYSPNKISKPVRVFNILWAVFLVFVLLYGIHTGSIVYPGARGSGQVIFQGWSLGLFSLALLSGAGNAILTVIDHYDKRDNELQYKKISQSLNVIGVLAIIVAFGYQFVTDQKPAVVLSFVS
ncbi:MAG: hypothetical protein Alis3KO_41020 [Aliiglaciecola sp.]